MRGIPEDKAVEIGERIDSCKYLECSVKEWLRDECRELQEPWMPIDEFLKSKFIGACWVYTNTKFVYTAYYAKDGQFYESDLREYRSERDTIVRVIPIHQPEPPKL